ncbi:MAG: hypothetical protein LDL24_02745 [Treponema sp.]|nr:hypothetical protein [Treponema sp.]
MKRIGTFIMVLIVSSSLVYAQNETVDYKELNNSLLLRFDTIAIKSRNSRTITGSIMTGLGAISVAAGALVALSPSSNPDEARMLGIGLMAGGGVLVGLSIPIFLIPSYQEQKVKTAEAYKPESEFERYKYLDKTIEDLAASCRMRRLLAAGIFTGVGVGNFLWGSPLAGTVLVCGALVPLFIESPAETEWKQYVQSERITEKSGD